MTERNRICFDVTDEEFDLLCSAAQKQNDSVEQIAKWAALTYVGVILDPSGDKIWGTAQNMRNEG